MHHTRFSNFEGNVGVVYPKSAQMTSLRRDDRGRAVTLPPSLELLDHYTSNNNIACPHSCTVAVSSIATRKRKMRRHCRQGKLQVAIAGWFDTKDSPTACLCGWEACKPRDKPSTKTTKLYSVVGPSKRSPLPTHTIQKTPSIPTPSL